MNRKMSREPMGFDNSRLEIQMFFQNRAAEFAGDENGIANFCAASQNLFSVRNGSEQRDGNENALRIRRRLAAGNGDSKFLCEFIYSVINFCDKLRVKFFWQTNRHERGARRSSHCRD